MYAAAGAMIVGMKAGDVHAGNLANANTPGFRADRLTFGSFQRVLLAGMKNPDGTPSSMYQSVTTNASVVDLRPGALNTTGAPMDLAVEGDGWFVVAGPRGEQYTRDGHLARDLEGRLVTSGGWPLLSREGTPLVVPDTEDFAVSEAGEVVSGGRTVGRLRLVKLTDAASVVKDGGNLVSGGAPVEDSESRVEQGMLEASNADAMRTMVAMMTNLRFVEMNQRVIQAQDQSLERAIDVARR
jgi:flagellar basal body rod protein FlgG